MDISQVWLTNGSFSVLMEASALAKLISSARRDPGIDFVTLPGVNYRFEEDLDNEKSWEPCENYVDPHDVKYIAPIGPNARRHVKELLEELGIGL
jgi:hypothetical protein